MARIKSEQVGGGVVGGQGGGQLEAGYAFHKDTNSSVVSLLSNRNKHILYNSEHSPR